MHCAEHVGAVGEDFGFSGEDLDVADVQAGEVVEALHGDFLGVVDFCGGQAGDVDCGFACEVDDKGFAREYGFGVAA